MAYVEQLGDHTAGIKRSKQYPEALARAALVRGGCTGRQEHEFAVGVATLAEVERLTPVVKPKCARDWHLESPFCGELCEVAKHVVAQVPGEAVANPQLFGGGAMVADREDAARVAPCNPDEVGQHVTDRTCIQDQVRDAPAD